MNPNGAAAVRVTSAPGPMRVASYELTMQRSQRCAAIVIAAGVGLGTACNADVPTASSETTAAAAPRHPPLVIDAARGDRERVLARNRELVTRATGRFPHGRWSVRGYGHAQWSSCPRGEYGYTVSRDAEGLRIGISLAASAPGASRERAAEMLAAARSCADEFGRLWAAYELRVDVGIELAAADPARHDFAVELVDAEGRDNAQTYHFRPGADLCAKLAHEWGHLLGFADEYEEPGTCRDKPAPLEDPPSIMAMHDAGSYEFHPRHVQQVLEQAWPELELTRRRRLHHAGMFQGGTPMDQRRIDRDEPWCQVFESEPDAKQRATFRLFRQLPVEGADHEWASFSGEGLSLVCKDAITPHAITRIMGRQVFEILHMEPVFPDPTSGR